MTSACGAHQKHSIDRSRRLSVLGGILLLLLFVESVIGQGRFDILNIGSTWNSALPDDVLISHILIPGTHNSGAIKNYSLLGPIPVEMPIPNTGKCQDLTITQQLEMGIRFLDIRGRHLKDKLEIYHDKVYQGHNFGDVLKECYAFLNKNEGEFIIMRLKKEYDSKDCTRDYLQTFDDYISQDTARWYLKSEIPRLKDVRGKIVLLNDFGGGRSLDFSNPNNRIQDDAALPTGNYFSFKPSPDVDWKWKKIEDFFNAARNGDPNRYYVNFASGYWQAIGPIETPIGDIPGTLPWVNVIADDINPRIKDYLRELPRPAGKWGCIIPMDFVQMPTVRIIISKALEPYGIYPGYLCEINYIAENEFLYAADYDPADKDRRKAFTWVPGGSVKQGLWCLQPLGGNRYNILNYYQGEYLYAVTDIYKKDKDCMGEKNDRRCVFTWGGKEDIENQGVWILDLIDGTKNRYRIRNLAFNEPLYAVSQKYWKDEKCKDDNRRCVFTWGGKDELGSQNDWEIRFKCEPPTKLTCPDPIILNTEPGKCSAKAIFQPSVTASCPATATCTAVSGSDFPAGKNWITYVTVDVNDKKQSCTFSITVLDNELPYITCPAKITISCEESLDPKRTGQATATDNCSIKSITYNDQRVNGRCTHEYLINRTWTATDAWGNTSTCLQQINVEDKKPPAITCPPNITVTCDTTTAQTGLATAVDNCDPALDFSRKDVHLSGYCEWFCILDRHWQALDDCGNTSKCVQRITKNTAPLLEKVLPVTLGNNNTTLAIPAGKADCIIKWMPYTGTTPGTLTSGKSGMSPDCIPAATKLDANGRLIDPLVGEALKLSLLVKLNPALGTRKLSSFPGYTLDPILKQALAPDPDVNELLRVTNLNLGATMVIWSNPDHAMLLLNLFKHINGPRDVCNP